MRQSITQEFDYGCGIACFAFSLGVTYQQAVRKLGQQQAYSTRFWVKDLVRALNKADKQYQAKHIDFRLAKKIYNEGTIVLIRRSKQYPVGHYLIRHAKSGFRKRLPGKPMYALLPQS